MLTKLVSTMLGCALLLAFYYVGVRTAGAQMGVVEAANVEWHGGTFLYTGVVGRTYLLGINAPGNRSVPLPVPGSSRIIATGDGETGFSAVLENGDVYEWSTGYDTSIGTWVLTGNLISGGTGTTHGSWGELKVRSLPER